MTKRKKIVFALLAVLVLATAGFLYLRMTEKPIRVTGNLSPEEVATIKSIVRREIWRNTFPDFSLKTIRQLPGGILTSLRLRIDSIESLADDGEFHKTASVKVMTGKSSRGEGYTYVCARSSNQWIFVVRVGPPRYIDSEPIRKLTP